MLTQPPPLRHYLPAIALGLLLAHGGQAQTIIDDDFDGAEVMGWISQGNTRTISDHNITQANSIITSEVIPSQSNTNRGIVSETSFSPNATGGFTMTFVADSVGARPDANGYFIGLVRDNDVFHRDSSTKNFGLVFFGQNARTVSGGGFGLIYGDNNAANPADFQLADSDAQGDVELDSLLDGFTATVTVNLDGWAYEITGLRNAANTEMTFTDAGLWADAGTDFDTLWPAGDEWHIMGAFQEAQNTAHTISFDRITLVGGAGAPRSQLEISHDVDSGTLSISWDSEEGMLYNLRSVTDPSSAPPKDWAIFDGQMDLAATPPTNTLEFALPGDATRFFAVEEFPPPPVTVFAESFDGPDPGWTTGFAAEDTGMNTAWELGDPAGGPATGPLSANSGPNCYGTNIQASYGESSDIWLRSPGTIDLTTASEATLVFQQFRDIEPSFDVGSIRVLKASDDTQLGADLLNPTDGTGTAWEEITVTLPSEALGELIKIEFRFQSDEIGHQAGWYIDDVEVFAR